MMPTWFNIMATIGVMVMIVSVLIGWIALFKEWDKVQAFAFFTILSVLVTIILAFGVLNLLVLFGVNIY